MDRAYSMSRCLLYLLDLIPVWACSCLTVIESMNASGDVVWTVVEACGAVSGAVWKPSSSLMSQSRASNDERVIASASSMGWTVLVLFMVLVWC